MELVIVDVAFERGQKDLVKWMLVMRKIMAKNWKKKELEKQESK